MGFKEGINLDQVFLFLTQTERVIIRSMWGNGPMTFQEIWRWLGSAVQLSRLLDYLNMLQRQTINGEPWIINIATNVYMANPNLPYPEILSRREEDFLYEMWKKGREIGEK